MQAVDKLHFNLMEREVKVIKTSNDMSIKPEDIPDLIEKHYENETEEKDNSNELNIEHLCRICLLTRKTFFTSLSETCDNLLDIYFAVTSIKVDKESHVFKICERCKMDLTFSYNFKNKCLKSDLIFKTIIDEIKTNEDDGTRTTIKIENSWTETEEDIEHEDVQYLDDTLDYDMVEDNDERISITITREIETVKNKRKANPDSRRRNKHKSKQKYNCAMCPKKFLKAQTLKDHMKSEHWTQLSHSCNQCNKSFSSEHDLQLHLPIHSKTDVWTCKECNKQFNDRRQFCRHIQRHMKVKRHACAACGKMFAELYALRRHERVHTGQVLHKPYACQLCDKRYRYQALLRAHSAQHSGARPCACAACGKTFASQRLLASHSLVHLDHKPHKCDYCDKTFRHESTRNTHHRTHTGERPHVCARCGNTFIQRSNLVRHMRVHTGEKPYTCKVCERKFGCGSSLKNHMTTHTGDKPYQCTVCNKRFSRSNMRLHMALHTGERPHACAACGKRFARPWALREHSRLHTGEKPFECAKCNDKFSSKSQLMRHHRARHEKNNKPVMKEVVQKPKITKPYVLPDKIVFSDDRNETIEQENASEENVLQNNLNTDSKIISAHDMPLVTEEVILQDNDDKVDLIENSETSQYFTRDENASEKLQSHIRYIEMTENGPNISSAILEDGGIKLYQLDQIHRSGRELTVRKVTSMKTKL